MLAEPTQDHTPGALSEAMLEREAVANKPKHWVRLVTACNSHCIFCLDSDTPRDLYLPVEEIQAEIIRGRVELGAEKIIMSGGEASLHPAYPELIRFALEQGYDRVQTVTNGWRYADKAFFDRVMEAGLGEITFSLHGHNAELHDRLTRHPGSFDRLIKGLVRALRDRRPIVNVDVVINKQNVGVLDKILELCISLGVTEYDLLHVIPQADAFNFRDELFYDPREHLDVLHKVFRLNRHPRFVIWTNRFPVSFLEGLEDLIQDPHKMLDEVNGRRTMVRAYLDTGRPLDCRDPNRCQHCFIEPMCTTMDRVMADTTAERWEIWDVGAAGWRGEELPFGARTLGLEVARLEALAQVDLPAAASLYVRSPSADPLSALAPVADRGVTLVASTAAQLDAWFGDDPTPDVSPEISIDVALNRQTAAWLLAHRAQVAAATRALRVHQPSWESMAESAAHDVEDPRAFFLALDLPLPVSGLPACLAPGARLVDERKILPRGLFDAETGRLGMRPLARYHVAQRYRAKSLRCADCVVNDRCEGIPINMIRSQGLKLATPLTAGPEADAARATLTARWPLAPLRLASGRPAEPAPPSLPGFTLPTGAPVDPLATAARQRDVLREERRKRFHGASPAGENA
jgi:MoaA/NifB/PqqE/SkfB family radical SAM enzyme